MDNTTFTGHKRCRPDPCPRQRPSDGSRRGPQPHLVVDSGGVTGRTPPWEKRRGDSRDRGDHHRGGGGSGGGSIDQTGGGGSQVEGAGNKGRGGGHHRPGNDSGDGDATS